MKQKGLTFHTKQNKSPNEKPTRLIVNKINKLKALIFLSKTKSKFNNKEEKLNAFFLNTKQKRNLLFKYINRHLKLVKYSVTLQDYIWHW